MKIGITCYPTYGGSGAVATELGIALAAARPRDPLHHVPAAVPAAGVPAADLLPRSGRRPVSAVRVSAVRPRARGAHARGGARRTGSTCCTATTRFRTRRARGSRGRCSSRRGRTSASSRRCTARTSRSSARTRRSTPITKFSIEKSDGLTAVSRFLQTETLTTFGCTGVPHRGDPQLHRSRGLRPLALHRRFSTSRSTRTRAC